MPRMSHKFTNAKHPGSNDMRQTYTSDGKIGCVRDNRARPWANGAELTSADTTSQILEMHSANRGIDGVSELQSAIRQGDVAGDKIR